MDTLEAIRTRRSIRRYKAQAIREAELRTIVAAGMSAPSAGNEQPWHFIVIKDRRLLEAIPRLNPYAAMARDASVAILVCGDLRLERFKGFWVQDCAAATQNMLLAAHALGLGAVWTGIYPLPDRVEGFKKLFNLPEDVIPFALIPLGYPDQAYRSEDRFKPERIHEEVW